MRATRPAVVKIAVTANRLNDCLRLRLDTSNDSRHVAIAMGSAGRLTRVLPAWTGSAWTYSGSAAPGQLSTRDLVDIFRVRQTTPASAVYGIVGSPLGHSASPAMHNVAFAESGIDAVYVPIETGDADEFLEMADALSLCGASVTAPLKRELAPRCSATDEVTTSAGAVNTLRRSAQGWEGRNFDTDGFLAPLDRAGAAQPGSTAVILGAGGAARGAAWALVQRGVRVAVAARRQEAAAEVARDVEAEVAPWPPAIDADLVVNATPIGAWPRTGVSPVDAPRGRLAYDLVYNPVDTEFLVRARAAGARTIGGLEMLVEQAARQFEWWTGRAAPRSTFDRAARRFLASLAS
jgi:shikimate dehydrogenase